jgi:hypothetical protein
MEWKQISEFGKTNPEGVEQFSPSGWSVAEPWEIVEKLIEPRRGDTGLSFPTTRCFCVWWEKENK